MCFFTPAVARDDLIIVAVHHERGHRDLLEVRSEIGLRERHDAVVVRFSASHHALAPPILNDALEHLGAAENPPPRPARLIDRKLIRTPQLIGLTAAVAGAPHIAIRQLRRGPNCSDFLDVNASKYKCRQWLMDDDMRVAVLCSFNSTRGETMVEPCP
jgi:hypothetical protein